MAFKAKNLNYEAKEPAFLSKLRSQAGGFDTDRQERPVARPRKAKAADEDDDAPTYVDAESNQNLSKEEYEALVKGPPEGASDGGEGPASSVVGGPVKEARLKQTTSMGAASKKRKALKVGDEEPGGAEMPVNAPTKQVAKKPKKKVKPVALSFENDEA